MSVSNLAMYDYGNIPTALGPNFQTAFAPAVVSFDVVWSGPITRSLSVSDGVNLDHFAGDFEENQATVTWSGTNLATGFSFIASPGNFLTSAPGRAFAELGHMQNGNFFSSDSSEDHAAVQSLTQALPTQSSPKAIAAAPAVAIALPALREAPVSATSAPQHYAPAISADPGGSDSPQESSGLLDRLLLFP